MATSVMSSLSLKPCSFNVEKTQVKLLSTPLPMVSPWYHKFNSFKQTSLTPQVTPSITSHYSSLSTHNDKPHAPHAPHHTPKTPLFMRPPIHSTTPSNLNTFITWANNLISSIDDDLDPSLLQRELKWFLDDIVEEPSASASASASAQAIHLRVSLETMYQLWEDRVVKRRPFQYVVGCERWRDLKLSVEEGILIPRPETQEIVDFVEGLGYKGGVWADLGTGSGALAIGIARVLGGQSKVIATDVSPIALAVAKYNVERYGLQDVIEIRQGSWFDPVMEFEGQLAGLVSNPPYVPRKDTAHQARLGKHEPWLAFDGGVDGLDFLSYLCSKTSSMLKPGGFFAFETNGEGQCKILADYLKNVTGDGICDVNIVSDFAGVPRFVTGHRKHK